MTAQRRDGHEPPRVRLLRRWTWRGRLAGLIGRHARRPRRQGRLAGVAGLWLGPCAAVHTFGMRYAIDVIFLDGRGQVVRRVPALRPWRCALCLRAVSVVEFESGLVCLEDRGVRRIEAAVQNAARGNVHRDLQRADHRRGQSDGNQHAGAEIDT